MFSIKHNAVGAEDVAASRSKIFRKNWLDLGKYGWIWAKFGQN